MDPDNYEDNLQDNLARVRHHSVGDIPRRTARRLPDKVAIIDGDVTLTFAEFDALVDRAAAALHARHLAPGARLALLSRNCWQYAVLAFATARAAVVLVPVNFMLTAEEVAYILGHCRADAFIAAEEFLGVAVDAVAISGTSPLQVAFADSDGAIRAGWEDFADWLTCDQPTPAPIIGDDQLLRLMYTSGTESRPKGVMHSSRSLMWQYMSTILSGSMSEEDVEVHSMPLYHCAQLDNFLATDIYLGATSIIVPRPDPDLILPAIERYRVTNFFAPPTVWISLLRSPIFDSVDLSSLRKGYYGASAMPREILAEMRERMPNVSLWNFYGQTEMAPLASVLPPEDQERHSGAAGRPVHNVETSILDEEDNPVAPGTVGEIAHRSPHLMLGYLDDPTKTAEAFRGGWFHSGDLGYYDDSGLLHVVDRKKDMIKTGGENVASREVEEVIYKHPAVQEVAVFGVAHPTWVEAVVAAVVTRDGTSPTAEDIIAHCREHLAGFKTPKQVHFVASLPKNPSGKLLKRELRNTFDAARTASNRIR